MANGRRVSGAPGTGFTNWETLFQANSSGAQNLADRLASGADSEGTAASSGLDRLARDFYSQMTGGAVRYYPGMDAAQSGNFAERGYTGPDGLSDVAGYEDAMGAADRASQNATRLGSLYGRATALQEMAGNRDYSQGQQLLDSALAGRAGGSRFAQLGQQWGGLFNRAQGLERTASERAAQTRQSSEEARQRYAADAPRLRTEEERARNAQNDAYIAEQERIQDQNESRGGRAGEETPRRGRRNAPITAPKTSLDGWGAKGGWA